MRLPRLGIVLVTGKGFTLYAFRPDGHGTATCTSACAAVWPSFKLTPVQNLLMTPTLHELLVAFEHDPQGPAGSRLIKYGGWVLHTYAGDTSPGVARGQGLSSNGGHWYAISTAGKLVMKR